MPISAHARDPNPTHQSPLASCKNRIVFPVVTAPPSQEFKPPINLLRFSRRGNQLWCRRIRLSGSDADLLELNAHSSRDADLLSADKIISDSPLAMRSYLDHFGNRVTRVEVPAGLVGSNRFIIHDSGEPVEGRRRGDDADRRSSRRRVAVPGSKPVLRQLQARRFRLVAVRKNIRRLPARAGDLQFCSREGPLSPQAPPVARAIRCRKAWAFAATSLTSPSHSAVARTFPPAIAPAISATLAFRSISTPWISAPGSRSFSLGAGTRWTRVTTIPHRPHCHGARPRCRRCRDVDRVRRRQARPL